MPIRRYRLRFAKVDNNLRGTFDVGSILIVLLSSNDHTHPLKSRREIKFFENANLAEEASVSILNI